MTKFSNATLDDSMGFSVSSATYQNYVAASGFLTIPAHCYVDYNVKNYTPLPRSGAFLLTAHTGYYSVSNVNYGTGEIVMSYNTLPCNVFHAITRNGVAEPPISYSITDPLVTITTNSYYVTGTAPSRAAVTNFTINSSNGSTTVETSTNESSTPTNELLVQLSQNLVVSKLYDFVLAKPGHYLIDTQVTPVRRGGTATATLQLVIGGLRNIRGADVVSTLADYKGLSSARVLI